MPHTIYMGCFVMRSEYSDLYQKLGLNIAYYRKLNGLTQEKLAEKIHVDQTHISKIEVAAVGISLDLLFYIAYALDVAPNKFLEFRDWT